jgi:hypothetical protein
MTTKEFLRKFNLEMPDLDFIADQLTLGLSIEQVAEMMEIPAKDLKEFWE